jgi:aerobic carbon-monoxide dehydrogenase medium subunit
MKAAAFEYSRPKTLDEALALLGDEVRPIAGGQSLVPMMALRLVTPTRLVDLSQLVELRGTEIKPDVIRIGALTRWCDILSDARLEQHHPLLVEAVRHTAHYQIRNRGTVGGSCCHADPAAEMPAIAMTCEAEFEVVSRRGQRIIPAHNFFAGAFTTALAPDELLLSVRLPRWRGERRHGFRELARRQGDFAIAGCALFYDQEGGYCRHPHVGVFGVADTALRVREVEAVLVDRQVTDDVIREASRVLQDAVAPPSDVHGTSDYRRALLGVLCERALQAASCGRPESAP